MKQIFILAGVASMLACNSQSNQHTTNDDTSHHADAGKHHSNADAGNDMNPVTETMNAMMHEMHANNPTGNNDVDFAAMMLAHHKGAIEMSKVEIDKGRDAELRAFA